jgi:hypothetical protein
VLSFHYSIRTMHAAGVPDFSMADIYHPTFKRTKVHLSALINLCKFWAEQHGIYEVREPGWRVCLQRRLLFLLLTFAAPPFSLPRI